MRILYNLFIFTYTFIIRGASPFSKKAKLWVKGRQQLFEKIESALKNEKQPLIWVHSSSLGEFEQGRPVIEKLKHDYPDYKILLTFFSPSGYEIRKNYQNADYIFYLPADTPANAKKFTTITKPKIAIFIKYEYWFNYLNELYNNKIAVFFISAIFRNNHYFFKNHGKWSLNQLKKIDYFFVQNETSKNLLLNNGINHAIVSGDTRFDRVLQIAANPQALPLIKLFSENHKVIIAGSSWPVDDNLFSGLINTQPKGAKYIIVPHEIHDEYIEKLIKLFGKKACKLSSITEQNAREINIIIVDSIGLLSSMYAHAHIAYIGGGFGKGIHNTLEAACFGLPVIFGPHYLKFSEAVQLINIGGAFSINNEQMLIQKVNELLNDEKYYQHVSEICNSFVCSNSGATKMIMEKLKEYL